MSSDDSRARMFCCLLVAAIFASVSSPAWSQVLDEDFGTGFSPGVCNPVPAGWTTTDVDGNTPNGNVAYFTDAWCVIDDFGAPGNGVVASNSWYNPFDQSDDWLITPALTVPTNGRLQFRAKSQDPAFPESYEIRVSTATTDTADFLANPALASVVDAPGDWTNQDVSLSAYDGQSVYLAFRNVSDDKFLILVDDVLVESAPDYDATVTSPLSPSEYTRVPVSFSHPLRLGATVINEGALAITDVRLSAFVNRNGSRVATVVSAPIAQLDSEAAQVVTMPDFPMLGGGAWSIDYQVSLAEVDERPTNNTIPASHQVHGTRRELARDDGAQVGTLGIGPGTNGELGVQFAFPGGVSIREVRAFQNNQPDNVGESIAVRLRALDGIDGRPGTQLQESLPTVMTDVQGWQHYTFATPPALTSGSYFFGLTETDPNLVLAYTSSVATPRTNWVVWPASPFGDWAPVEDFGFDTQFMLRLFIVDPSEIFLDGFESGDTTAWSVSP